jgi:hypothetical protein
MASQLTFVNAIFASIIGALIALVAYDALAGKRWQKSVLARLFGGLEKYGTYSPIELKRINEPSDSLYEFPNQRNNARRPARTNNRTLPAVYPTSGSPSALPTAPMSTTRTPGGPYAAAHDEGLWSESQALAFGYGDGDQTLLDDLLPSETARPVKTFADVYGARLSGRASRTPLDS